MKTLYTFLTGYCVAEMVSHSIFYFGGSLPFQSFGMTIDASFNIKAFAFYTILAIIFGYLAFGREKAVAMNG